MFSKLLANSKQPEDVDTGSSVLRVLTKFMILIGLVFITFGPNYSALLLNTLYGHKFSDTDAATVLSWYCVYVAVIAVNGITEAFVHAVATPEELRRFNYLLIFFSALYLVCATVFVRVIETSGLIFANCVNGRQGDIQRAVYTQFFSSNMDQNLPPLPCPIYFPIKSW